VASNHVCLAKLAESFRLPSRAVEITYEGTTLPGYLFNGDGSGERSPTVATIRGMNGYQEETYVGAVAALERGYNCLTYDGPGQGGVLRPRPASWFGPQLGEVCSVARRLGVFADRGIVVENERVGLLTSVPDDQRDASTTKL
jgi:alpha-beta hydrolase superfamily lysophospholipase